MKVQVSKLRPWGMVLLKDVVGKSGRPIIEKQTKLTEQHILFLDKFMIPSVNIVPPSDQQVAEQLKKTEEAEKFEDAYEDIVKYYTNIFTGIQNNIPLNDLFAIRKRFIPFFETVQKQPFTELLRLPRQHRQADRLFYKSVAMSAMAVYIAARLGYERKEWLQVGFAALLSDVGFARMSDEARNERDSSKPSEAFRMHPFHSYKLVEEITTLTKHAKVAILQHQERLDGSGYPAKISAGKLTPYTRIIAVCDFLYLIDHVDLSETIYLLEDKKGVELDKQVTGFLIEKLKSALA